MDKVAIHKLYVGTFETELGKRCLSHLEDVFVNRQIFKHGESVEHAAYRQGQADLVKQLKKEINNG
mgnify:CR=1 FL=1